MIHRKTAYELSESQVATPEKVVAEFWTLIAPYRGKLGTVLDMGAGDCRFAKGGTFGQYVGVEIDKKRVLTADPPRNGKLIHGCAFRHVGKNYDACIGNPPYVRHHDIERPWKDQTAERLGQEFGVSLNKHSNLYLYFFWLGLSKTKADGLLALVIPYEWVSRPSAKGLRSYIWQQKWNVAVYRFQMPIFEGVLTTASITVIDKRGGDGKWVYHDILPDFQIRARKGVVDTEDGILDYADRGDVWALRGLSPGSQKIFTLTETERIDAGLTKWDVDPCVTSLKHIPREIEILSNTTFQKHFVDAGRRCWLIKSHQKKMRPALQKYLKSIAKKKRSTWTCLNQSPWYKFNPHPLARLLVSSGFTKFGPKVVRNTVRAQAVGSVYGVHSRQKLPIRKLQSRLLAFNFEDRLVAHAKTLKKIEVKQLNGILQQLSTAPL